MHCRHSPFAGIFLPTGFPRLIILSPFSTFTATTLFVYAVPFPLPEPLIRKSGRHESRTTALR